MKKLPWLRMRKKTDPELPLEPPIWLGNESNGEYFRPATRKDRKIRRLILEKADENARYLGVDRREFLASAAGMASVSAGGSASAGVGGGTASAGTLSLVSATPDSSTGGSAGGSGLLPDMACATGTASAKLAGVNMLVAFDPELKEAKVDLAKTFDDRFVKKAAGM